MSTQTNIRCETLWSLGNRNRTVLGIHNSVLLSSVAPTTWERLHTVTIYVIKHIIKKIKKKRRLDTLVLYQFTVLFSAQFSDLCKLRRVDFNVDIIEVTCPRGCASSLNQVLGTDFYSDESSICAAAISRDGCITGNWKYILSTPDCTHPLFRCCYHYLSTIFSFPSKSMKFSSFNITNECFVSEFSPIKCFVQCFIFRSYNVFRSSVCYSLFSLFSFRLKIMFP